jgi:PadR family transcriptional regulator PadR
MATPKTDLLQGTLDLLILRALLLQADHGVGITRRSHQITRGTCWQRISAAIRWAINATS